MATATHPVYRNNHRKALSPFSDPAVIFRLHDVFTGAVRAVGERMERVDQGAWEGRSLDGSHVWSRNDLESNGLLIRTVCDLLAREGFDLPLTFETEELSLLPQAYPNGSCLRGIIDPIDGTKAFDNWVCGGPLPIPRPSSAISVAVVCPTLGEIILSALYCFDLGEVFSSVYLGRDDEGKAQYCAFRDKVLIPSLSSVPQAYSSIEAKRRILNCDYNARCLEQVARLNLGLMDRGLKAAYGGLAGSSATDIINVVRGSFAACIDVRALCSQGGSVLYLYDVAGALPIALGRGFRVILVNADGTPLEGGNHPIYTPVSLVVARPDVADTVVDAVRNVICPHYYRGE